MKYFEYRNELDEYTESLNQGSLVEKFLVTWSPASMLFRIASPIVNIVGNVSLATEQGSTTAIANLLSAKGYLNNKDLIGDYIKRIWQINLKSGYDLSRMRALTSNKFLWGEKRSVAIQNKIGRWYTDIVFKYSLGAPDVFFASAHFSNYLALAAESQAKKEGLSGD